MVALWGMLGRVAERGASSVDDAFLAVGLSSGVRLVEMILVGLEGVECIGGRGEMGTFQMTASSGTSSSES
jgi:hypothetical protein